MASSAAGTSTPPVSWGIKDRRSDGSGGPYLHFCSHFLFIKQPRPQTFDLVPYLYGIPPYILL